MSVHRVSVYTRAGVLAHVQSTNGDEWPLDLVERKAGGGIIPLVRKDVELEPTADEIKDGTDGRPLHRRASVLFAKELEVVAGEVRYRAGEGAGGAINDRVAAEPPE